jgi:hypothetical protein
MILFLSWTQYAFALSPPWYLFQSKMKATIGNDSCVQVSNLTEGGSQSSANYLLDIHVSCDNMGNKAQALADLLVRTYSFGNPTVQVRIFDSGGRLALASPIPSDPNATSALMQEALSTNRLFVGVHPGRGRFPISIEFKHEVVQYFADNLSDYYGNMTQVASEAFRDILQFDRVTSLRTGFTTEPVRN